MPRVFGAPVQDTAPANTEDTAFEDIAIDYYNTIIAVGYTYADYLVTTSAGKKSS